MKEALGGCSRAAKMIQMAVGADAVVSQKPRGKRHQTFLIGKKTTASNGSRFEPKELRPENIEYLSKNPVGSGSFGQCFLGRYRGFDVIVKQMTHNETSEDKERARRDLLCFGGPSTSTHDFWCCYKGLTIMPCDSISWCSA